MNVLDEVIHAALTLQAAYLWNANHPGDPNSEAQIELGLEILDEAIDRYVIERTGGYWPPADPTLQKKLCPICRQTEHPIWCPGRM